MFVIYFDWLKIHTETKKKKGFLTPKKGEKIIAYMESNVDFSGLIKF